MEDSMGRSKRIFDDPVPEPPADAAMAFVSAPGDIPSVPGLDLAISLDTTGSMYPCKTQAKRNLRRLVTMLMAEVPFLRVAIIGHGDYCDEKSSYVTKILDFTTDADAICRFVDELGQTWGGDSPECYELVLRKARSLSWTAGKKKAFILIGDDEPHPVNYPQNTLRIDWKNELDCLREATIQVFGVHALPGIRPHSRYFYEMMARMTGGQYLNLDRFDQVEDLIKAICYSQAKPEKMPELQQQVRAGYRMTRGMAQSFEALTGQSVAIAASAAVGLVPVPAGRFQLIHVDHKTPIMQFVSDQGLKFKRGRAFYEFVESEIIQEKKEVVLLERATGDLFTGPEARNMIGLPFGMRGRVKPVVLEKYRVFIQSTSNNRNLDPNTDLLYEVNDWERAAA